MFHDSLLERQFCVVCRIWLWLSEINGLEVVRVGRRRKQNETCRLGEMSV